MLYKFRKLSCYKYLENILKRGILYVCQTYKELIMAEKYLKNIDYKSVMQMKDLIEYSEGSISSKTIVQRDDFSISLVAFDEEEGLSKHTAPGDAFVYALEGNAVITLGDESFEIKEGETLVMPANVPHQVDAVSKYKMLLIVVKPETGRP